MHLQRPECLRPNMSSIRLSRTQCFLHVESGQIRLKSQDKTGNSRGCDSQQRRRIQHVNITVASFFSLGYTLWTCARNKHDHDAASRSNVVASRAFLHLLHTLTCGLELGRLLPRLACSLMLHRRCVSEELLHIAALHQNVSTLGTHLKQYHRARTSNTAI